MAANNNPTTEVLAGLVERVTFHNEDNGFCVLRVKARAGVKPDFVTYANGDPDGYALAVNINRRHLKASARHLIKEMARRVSGAKLPQSLRAAAKEADVDRHRFMEAAVVLDYAPDLVEKIFAGGKPRARAVRIALNAA
jgi:hypothetical protein